MSSAAVVTDTLRVNTLLKKWAEDIWRIFLILIFLQKQRLDNLNETSKGKNFTEQNIRAKLEMCQYDTDAPAQSHPQPHAGIKKWSWKKVKINLFKKNIRRKTSFEGEKGP